MGNDFPNQNKPTNGEPGSLPSTEASLQTLNDAVLGECFKYLSAVDETKLSGVSQRYHYR